MHNSATNHPGMPEVRSKQGKITPEHRQEAAKLKALWEEAKATGSVTSQEAFIANSHLCVRPRLLQKIRPIN